MSACNGMLLKVQYIFMILINMLTLFGPRALPVSTSMIFEKVFGIGNPQLPISEVLSVWKWVTGEVSVIPNPRIFFKILYSYRSMFKRAV